MEIHELRGLIEEQRALMNAVAVRAKEIEDVQEEYKARRKTIATELRRRGLDDPNPLADLWDWYHHWKENFPTWAERRQYVSSLYRELLDALDNLAERELGSGLHEAATGWGRVDAQLAQLRERYATARTEEDFQGVGLLCREIFVSLADACYDRGRHRDASEPATGVKERLDAAIEAEAGGASNKELRKLLKATIDLANKVQHDREGALANAAVAAEATVAGATLMRIVTQGAAPITEPEEEPEPDHGHDDIPF